MPIHSPTRYLLAAILAAGLLVWSLPAAACPVCVDQGSKTLADQILEARVVALARPDPDDPLRFRAVGLLQGAPNDLEDLPPIPFGVDAATAGRLADNPGLSVLMTYSTDWDPGYGPEQEGPWYRHMIVTAGRRAMIDGIFQRGDGWDWGATTDADRFAFFAARVADPDPVIRDLALAEISRAPYAMIRTLTESLTAAEIRRHLASPDATPYAPVLILLLGASADPAGRDAARAGFERAMHGGSDQFPAWLVAGVEAGGKPALAQVTRRLTDAAPLDPQERWEIVTALSVIGSAREDFRDAIVPALAAAVHRYPELAADVAYTFFDWREWSLNPHFAELLEPGDPAGGGVDHATRYILEIVLAEGARATAD